MRAVKRATVLVIEVIAEAALLGCLLGSLASRQIGLLYGVIGSVLALPVILFLHWYYLSRALAVFVWTSNRAWLYPAVAGMAFLVHMSIVFVRLNPDMINPGPFVKTTEIPFLAGGACIVFACAYGGNRFSRKWIQERRVAHPSTGTVAQNAGGTSTPSSATQTSSCSPQGTGTWRPQ